MTWRDTFASLSTEDKIAAAILCAWPTTDSIPWRRWAVGWLTGEDRDHDVAGRVYNFVPIGRPVSWALTAARYPTTSKPLELTIILSIRAGIDPDPILDDIPAGDLQRYIDRAEQELAHAP